MIEINLLPKELRKKRSGRTLPSIPVIPVSAGLVALVLVFHFLLISVNSVKRGTLKRLEKQWQEMQPQKRSTDKIAKETNELEKRVNAIKKIAEPELNWTSLLSGLNRSIIPGIWLSGLNLEYGGKPHDPRNPGAQPTKLVLVGYAVGKSEVATTTVARFINSLKKNQEFSGYFKDIELDNMRAQAVGGEETMLFRLSCGFEKKAGKGGDEKTKSGKKAKSR
jgi:Tfp pilus assembly protein PilN